MNNLQTFTNTSQIPHQNQNGLADVITAYGEKRPRVLLAQDGENHCETLRELLELYDLEVLEAESGEAAVDGAVIYRPDLIIMDKNLPGLGSFDAMRLIRAISSLRDVPMIFLSDYPERTERLQAFSSGADDYLIKPLDLDRVDRVLEKFLFLKI
jgi:Response regulator containing a CheY-like receiver domain and an HD-GYP domain